ncbi:ROK family protein [Streptomyces sp. 4N509B]|uniref:ROK family protein n=1 Tax=Streptomyces sp. 4N509B TaxID=3457413 RepID=UPI003FD0EE66
MAVTVIALDVGGTVTKGAVLREDGTVREPRRVPTGAARGPEAVVATVLDLAAELAERAPGAAALGLAVPGLVDAASGTAVFSANLGFRDLPLRALARRRLRGLPVALDNDVRAGALAEATRGAGRGGGDFLFVPIGTGIAAALVLGGRPYPGHGGDSGELGHVAVRPGGRRCRCGRRGCLEAYASASALARLGGAPAPEVIARAAAGDARAGRAWETALDALAEALAGATLLLDPARIVLGGGLAEAGDALVVPLAERLAARLPFRAAPPLARAAFGELAALHGAGLLAVRLASGRREAREAVAGC